MMTRIRIITPKQMRARLLGEIVVVVVHSDEQGFIAVRDGEKGAEGVYNS